MIKKINADEAVDDDNNNKNKKNVLSEIKLHCW